MNTNNHFNNSFTFQEIGAEKEFILSISCCTYDRKLSMNIKKNHKEIEKINYNYE